MTVLYFKLQEFYMKYSLSFRLWHWLSAFVVLGLLGTVFLRKTFLSWRTNSEILLSKLQEMGVEISIEQAKILAKAIRAGMWEWHILLGYALVALLFYRAYVAYANRGTKESFSSLSLHKKGVQSLYYLFYSVLIFMSASGLVIHFYEELHLAKESASAIKELHELAYNFFLFFVPLHVVGVLIAENRDERGLISSMIHGKH